MATKRISATKLTQDTGAIWQALSDDPSLQIIITRFNRPFAKLTRYTEDETPQTPEPSSSAPGDIGAPSLGQSDALGASSIYTEIARE